MYYLNSILWIGLLGKWKHFSFFQMKVFMLREQTGPKREKNLQCLLLNSSTHWCWRSLPSNSKVRDGVAPVKVSSLSQYSDSDIMGWMCPVWVMGRTNTSVSVELLLRWFQDWSENSLSCTGHSTASQPRVQGVEQDLGGLRLGVCFM